ncbi:MAG: ribosome silencing factor [Candidatus Eremiobacteraeota bacterium]|nr:ribosome silencing factor [Candidatus Eremiobacteraeota bacterium]
MVIDLEGRTIIADAFAIVTGRSKIQTRSIADAITEAVKAHGFNIARTEGYGEGTWILLDAGDVIVHIFTPEQREFYNLERLWGGADARKAQST